MYLDTNNLYGWEMSPKLPTNNFKQVEDLFQFNEDFIKIMMKTVIRDILLKQIMSIQKNYLIILKNIQSQLKEKKLENVESLFVTYKTKKTMLIT